MKSIKFYFFCLIVMIMCFFLSYYLINNDGPSSSSYIENEIEISLIYIGCSFCPAANDDEIPIILSNLKSKIENITAANDFSFSFIGISNEHDLETGINYLDGIAQFDEISIGNQMRNIAIQKYVWDNYTSELTSSYPQIIVVKRKYETENHNNEIFITPDIKSEEIVIRSVGTMSMKSLVSDSLIF
tara:strand:- start:9601 stop:10161 length:561 start_codon:yes stop_codon:yes gene_type:complete